MTVERILIVNLHAAQNLGDDGIMAGTLAGLARVYPAARITLAANDPASWQKYEGLEVTGSLCGWVADCRLGRYRSGLWRMPIILILLAVYALLFRWFGRRPGLKNPAKQQLLHAYYTADLVLSCGGGNFYAHHSPSPGFFWNLIALAFPLLLGKPVVMLPQSIGPITGRLQRALARHIFHRVHLIMVREVLSQNYLHDTLNVTAAVPVLPDLAFGLTGDAPPPAGDETPRTLHIGATVIDRALQVPGFTNQQQYERALAEVLAYQWHRHSAQIHLFVQCFGPSPRQDDRPATLRVAALLQEAGVPYTLADHFRDAADIQAAYARMDLVIATRMHTGIFALSRGVPTVMIAYQPKAQGIMADFGLSAYCLDIATVTPEGLLFAVTMALKNRESLRAAIQTHVQKIIQDLHQWEQLLAEEAWRG